MTRMFWFWQDICNLRPGKDNPPHAVLLATKEEMTGNVEKMRIKILGTQMFTSFANRRSRTRVVGFELT